MNVKFALLIQKSITWTRGSIGFAETIAVWGSARLDNGLLATSRFQICCRASRWNVVRLLTGGTPGLRCGASHAGDRSGAPSLCMGGLCDGLGCQPAGSSDSSGICRPGIGNQRYPRAGARGRLSSALSENGDALPKLLAGLTVDTKASSLGAELSHSVLRGYQGTCG